ncbi:DNA ligase 4 [Amphibalanus amphitrite]|uniref:DNA ligase n=1 Tax=Amphibalanus amphitrite TaxID=1232801 RepID=A0A6A4V6E1_AMPAM|nr:DNA ligase 4 [Amphibalanus amphitrite]
MSLSLAAARVPFGDFCTLCERLAGAPSKPRRLEVWRRFLARYRPQVLPSGGDSAFTLLRLLLPDRDRERGSYGAKHHRLTELYTAALGLPRASAAGQQLLRYRADGGHQHGAGDFGETLQHVLLHRCPQQDSGWSMQRIDDTLSRLAEMNRTNDRPGMQETMQQLVRTLSAREHKWLARIILKEMHLGLDANSLLREFHPDALDHWAVASCLRRLAAELRDPQQRLDRAQISLFNAFRPMLSERSGLERIDQQMKTKPFFVEPKHDGERVQLHKDGDRYMFFSRGGFDFTASYGGSPSAGSLVPHIHRQFRDTVRSCILDGEMLVWNDRERAVIVKAEAPDVKKLKPGGRVWPLFVPFDLVYLNGEVLTERPLSERLQKLKCVFRPLDGRLDVTTRLEVSTTEEVVEALNAAIDRQEEGLVLKDPQSLYRPNARRAGWVKVKPDYVDSLVDDLDLLIIGGYYGGGARRGTVCQFLLGAAEPAERGGEQPQLFLSAGTVSSGLTSQQLLQLQRQLMPHFRRTSRSGQPPPGLRWTAEKPDLWIEPCHSQILQVRQLRQMPRKVKATELVESSRHAAGLVPRFARVVAVRADKPWHQCVTTAELRQLRQRAGGKLATAHLQARLEDGGGGGETGGETGVPRRAPAAGRAGARPPAVAAHLRPTDLSGLPAESALLRDKQICVMTCHRLSDKAELERLVHQYGGSLTQNPTERTWCVIADRVTVKERSVVRSGRYDVVRSRWLRRLAAAGRPVPFAPSELLHATAATRRDTALHFDPFGDSYSEDVTEPQLKELLDAMRSEPAPAEPPSELLHRLAAGGAPPFWTLAGCRCFLAPPLHGATVAGLTVRLHGGRLSGALDGRVTHVVVPAAAAAAPSDPDTDREARLGALREQNRQRARKFHLVSERWVEECARRRQRAEERAFPP